MFYSNQFALNSICMAFFALVLELLTDSSPCALLC